MVREVPLTSGYVALIDDDDFDLVSGYSWHAEVRPTNVYARTRLLGMRPPGNRVYLHEMIVGKRAGLSVDHVDLNGLNCRRGNLRHASRSQQNQNHPVRRASGIKGVRLEKRARGAARPWYAQIKHLGKHHYLGCFWTEEEAGRAYDAAARRLFGEFARLNFPQEV